MPWRWKINKNIMIFFNYILRQHLCASTKRLNLNIRKKPINTNQWSLLLFHIHNRGYLLYCLLTSIFEASDEVLMMRPTTYFFIPCNQTDIKEIRLACTYKWKRFMPWEVSLLILVEPAVFNILQCLPLQFWRG